MCNPGQVYTVSRGKSGMPGIFRLESHMLPGNGNRISTSISTSTKDYIINYQDLQGIGMTDKLALPTLKLGGHEWLLRR